MFDGWIICITHGFDEWRSNYSGMNITEAKVTTIRPAACTDSAQFDFYSSRPAAGFPAPGDDMVEAPLDLNDLLIEHPNATFFVRVSGDSMEGARIFDGDILVVDRAVEPSDGAIVVAAVYGELVVKRLRQRSQQIELHSEQVGYEPIVVDAAEGVHIWGVVTGTARVLA
jgi:DNA polymerase V